MAGRVATAPPSTVAGAAAVAAAAVGKQQQQKKNRKHNEHHMPGSADAARAASGMRGTEAAGSALITQPAAMPPGPSAEQSIAEELVALRRAVQELRDTVAPSQADVLSALPQKAEGTHGRRAPEPVAAGASAAAADSASDTAGHAQTAEGGAGWRSVCNPALRFVHRALGADVRSLAALRVALA